MWSSYWCLHQIFLSSAHRGMRSLCDVSDNWIILLCRSMIPLICFLWAVSLISADAVAVSVANTRTYKPTFMLDLSHTTAVTLHRSLVTHISHISCHPITLCKIPIIDPVWPAMALAYSCSGIVTSKTSISATTYIYFHFSLLCVQCWKVSVIQVSW